MSLILDALNRAERERNAQQATPTLQSVHHSPMVVRRWHWEHGLIIALVIGLLLLAWLYHRHQPSAGHSPDGSVANARQTHVVSSGDVRSSIAPLGGHSGGADVGLSSVVATGANSDSNDTAGAATELAVADTISSKVRPAPQSGAVDQLYQDRLRPESTVEPAVAPTPPPQAAVQDAPPDPDALLGLAFRATPYITDLPLPLRRQIPSLNYSEHRATGEGGAVVVVNGQVWREGQTIAPDLKLVSIDAQGIVLHYQGVAFRLPKLNRWVNF